jgi:hypothetical protein
MNNRLDADVRRIFRLSVLAAAVVMAPIWGLAQDVDKTAAAPDAAPAVAVKKKALLKDSSSEDSILKPVKKESSPRSQVMDDETLKQECEKLEKRTAKRGSRLREKGEAFGGGRNARRLKEEAGKLEAGRKAAARRTAGKPLATAP